MYKLQEQLFILFLATFSLISCSNDDDILNEETNAPLVIILNQKTETLHETSTDSLQLKIEVTGNIIENKSQNLKEQTYNHGNLVSDTLHTIFEYDTNNNLTMSHAIGKNLYRLYYSTENKLTQINWKPEGFGTTIYYKITELPNNLIQYDRYEEPFTNPDAPISYRILLEFNDNEEVITAGYDTNFDSKLDSISTFTYDNGNLISFTNAVGEDSYISYSNIIDTKSFIARESFGKKELNILHSELYIRPRVDYFESSSLFYNVPQSSTETSSFNIHSSGYYHKKTTIFPTSGSIQTTIIEEFEFSSN